MKRSMRPNVRVLVVTPQSHVGFRSLKGAI